MDIPDFKCKIIFLGDAGVGKSSILRRYHRDCFTEMTDHTIGVDFFTTLMTKDSKLYKLQIWDTAGQEKFNSLITSYFKESTMAVIVFDTTDHTSFSNVQKWINDYEFISKTNNSSHLVKPIIIVGNKCDKTEEREVTKKDVEKYMNDNFISAEYIEVSAKDNLFIDKIYEKMLEFCCSLINSHDTETLKKFYAIKKNEKLEPFYHYKVKSKINKCCIIS